MNEATDLDRYWLVEALRLAAHSPDPETRVGAVIAIGRRRVSNGWNKLPDRLEHMHHILHDREKKLKVIAHAERLAVCWAAQSSSGSTRGATCYTVCTDDTGLVWGGSCMACTLELINAGVRRIVSPPYKTVSNWFREVREARAWGERAGLQYVEVSL